MTISEKTIFFFRRLGVTWMNLLEASHVRNMKKPGIFHGSVVGALLTALMIALFLLFWEIAGLSFPPFDLFDWLSGILPGSVVTYGIEHMVKLIRGLNLGNTAVERYS